MSIYKQAAIKPRVDSYRNQCIHMHKIIQLVVAATYSDSVYNLREIPAAVQSTVLSLIYASSFRVPGFFMQQRWAGQ